MTCDTRNMVTINFTVVNTVVYGVVLIAGWSLASLETLVCHALTSQAESQAGDSQESHEDQRRPDEASALMPSAATTLADMVQTYFSMHSTSVTQPRSQHSHQLAQSSAKLQTLLSLTGFLGSLSCPVSIEHGRHPPNLSVGEAADEQGYREASPAANEHASEAQPQAHTPDVGESTSGQSAQQLEVQGSTGSQQSSSLTNLQQVSSGSAKQCQEICLQVSFIKAEVCLIAVQL